MSNLYPDLYRTSFPNTVDQFTQYLDVIASDGNAIKLYQEAMKAGNQSLANQYLNQIPAFNQKILTAQDLNKFIDATIALERFYKSDIKPYTTGKQAEWQSIIDQFTYVGEYSISKSYIKNNYVSYGLGSSKFLYIALSDIPSGVVPTDARYWRQLTVRGTRGPSGEGLSFMGEWDGGFSYSANDCVSYGNALWNALKTSLAQEPAEGSRYWRLVYRMTTSIYPVTYAKPSFQENGELWFAII